jgi:hypothetical protein
LIRKQNIDKVKESMYMRLKKILYIMIIGMLVAPTAQSITAYAANTADSPFQFTLVTANSSTMYTENRDKTNDTSVYVYPTSLVGATKVGAAIRGKEATGSYTDVSAALYYYTTTKAYRVDNYAYERSCPKVALGIFAIDGNGSTSGVWSPDCANQYSYPLMPHS